MYVETILIKSDVPDGQIIRLPLVRGSDKWASVGYAVMTAQVGNDKITDMPYIYYKHKNCQSLVDPKVNSEE